MRRLQLAALAAFICIAPSFANAAESKTPAAQLMSKLAWRSIGPYIGGRSVAVAGVPGNRTSSTWAASKAASGRAPTTARTGRTSPTERFRASRARSARLRSPRRTRSIIYAGTGEADIRGDFDTGDGIYKTTDARQELVVRGPARDAHDRQARRSIRAIPTSSTRLRWATSFKPNAERGIFKTTDGGATWQKGALSSTIRPAASTCRWTRAIPASSTPRCGRRSAFRGS